VSIFTKVKSHNIFLQFFFYVPILSSAENVENGDKDNLRHFFFVEASRCAYKRNIILNRLRQHNYFIIQGTYIGYMFRLQISHLQDYFCHLSHKMLCTLWDPIVYKSM